MASTTEEQGRSSGSPREHQQDATGKEHNPFPWIQKYLDLADALMKRARHKDEESQGRFGGRKAA